MPGPTHGCYIGRVHLNIHQPLKGQAAILSDSFNQQFEQHSAWRREFALRLKLLVEWMKDHELVNAAVEERLKHLEARMRSDKRGQDKVAKRMKGAGKKATVPRGAGGGPKNNKAGKNRRR